jgi:hypothetical protein
MAKLGRPFTYQSEDEKPVTVSLRIPRDLHEPLRGQTPAKRDRALA